MEVINFVRKKNMQTLKKRRPSTPPPPLFPKYFLYFFDGTKKNVYQFFLCFLKKLRKTKINCLFQASLLFFFVLILNVFFVVLCFFKYTKFLEKQNLTQFLFFLNFNFSKFKDIDKPWRRIEDIYSKWYQERVWKERERYLFRCNSQFILSFSFDLIGLFLDMFLKGD